MDTKFTIALVCLFAVAYGTLPTKDCGSQHGKVISINLDPPPQGECTFPKGKNVSAIVVVEIDEVATKINVVVKGHVVIWVPFSLPNPDGCTQGITCPTTSGKQYKFSSVIPISSSYPNIRVPVQMEFQDQDGNDAICFQFPGEICD